VAGGELGEGGGIVRDIRAARRLFDNKKPARYLAGFWCLAEVCTN